jgi:predicted ribosomally synthesized peptide with SipW-like signal peptide
MNKSKTYLKLLLVVGLLAVVGGGAGTFASFNAETTNAGNVFATGTMILSNSVNGATACLSSAANDAANANSSCDVVIDSATINAPGGTVRSAHLTLENTGTIDATALKFWGTGCASVDGTASYTPTGDLCTAAQITVQETGSNFTTPVSCVYGGSTVTNTCDFSAASKTLNALPASGSPSNLGAMSAGGKRYFVVSMQLPSSATNAVQNKKATFGLAWHIDQ